MDRVGNGVKGNGQDGGNELGGGVDRVGSGGGRKWRN